MGETAMFCKLNEKFKDPDVIMDNSEIEDHVTKLCPDVCMEDAENHMIKLSPDAGTEVAESHVSKLSSDVQTENAESHMNKVKSQVQTKNTESRVTSQFESMLQAKHFIRQGFINNPLTYSDRNKINELQNSLKEAPELSLRPAPIGLVSEKISARQPHSNNTSIFRNSDSFQKMPESTFNETRADVADFLIQNPGNFRFTTTIDANALTLSFEPSPPPLLVVHNNDGDFPSPPYSPVGWDSVPTRQDYPIVAPFTDFIPTSSEPRAQSVDSGLGRFLSEDPSRQTLAHNPAATQDLEEGELDAANGDSECPLCF
jgi:hypothetical protein